MIHHLLNNERSFTWWLLGLQWLRLLFLSAKRIFIGIRFHCLHFFRCPWTLFSFITDEFGSLFICKTIPDTITSNYYEIVVRFDWHLLHIWVRWYLMFLAFINVAVGACLFLLLFTLFLCIFLLILLFNLIKHCRIFIFPVSNSPAYSNDSLDPPIINKSTSSLDSRHLTLIIWLVIVTQLCYLSILADQDCSWVTWIGTVDCVTRHQAHASSASSIKWNRSRFLFFLFIKFNLRTANCLFHLQHDLLHHSQAFVAKQEPVNLNECLLQC